MQLKKYDTIIIGGGISGLTSALLAAKRGQKTAVLEQGATLSPVMHGFDRKGVHFETGFHYASSLGKGEVGEFIFEFLGLDINPVPCMSDGYDEIHLKPTGRVFKMAYGRDKLEANLNAAFPEEKEAIKKYLDLVKENIEKSAFLNLHKGGDLDFHRIIDAGESLQQVLDRTFKSAEIKAVLAASTFLHGTPPSKIAFAQHCCVAGGLYDSVWEIEGGGLAVLEAYKKALTKAGVDVYLNTEAVKIEAAGDKKIITSKKEERFECDICISTVHPKVFFKIAPPEVYREGYKNRVKDIQETPGFFTIYAVTKEGVNFNKKNVFILNDLDIDRVFENKDHDSEYYINFSSTNPQAVSIISLTDPDAEFWDKKAPGYSAKKQEFYDFVIQNIRRIAPEIHENIEYAGASTPATMQRYAGYYSGYGLMHDVNKTKILPLTKIKGLYVSGQSVVAPGLLGAIITALLMDKLI
ncbi:all-trans-retinol 13 [Elusimicrobium posterum]|uniref:phytoene desaturase family protein n=1 Tax=Elusimicrobium posterum TaxID=3116653 RepID=UPI003C7608C6